MRDHKKIKAIRSKFKIQGYGIWCMILEYLTGSDGNVFPYSDTEFELMAGDFGVSATEIRDVVDYCIRLELLFNKNGFVNSDSLDERLAPVYEKRNKAKELSKQQQRQNGKFANSNTVSYVVSVAETPQSKVKESKLNETKVKESVIAVPATLEIRKIHFQNKVSEYLDTYSRDMLRNFFDYWTEKNEGGRKMRFEMQKVFDIGRRLKTWSNNEKNKSYGRKGLTIEGAINRINNYTDD